MKIPPLRLICSTYISLNTPSIKLELFFAFHKTIIHRIKRIQLIINSVFLHEVFSFLTDPCPPYFKWIFNTCLRYQPRKTTGTTYNTALTWCQQQDAELLRLDSIERASEIHTWLKKGLYPFLHLFSFIS